MYVSLPSIDGNQRSCESLEGATPLFVATFNGHDFVRYLVEKGDDISVTTAFSNGRYSGMTSLHGALTMPPPPPTIMCLTDVLCVHCVRRKLVPLASYFIQERIFLLYLKIAALLG